MIVGLSGVHFSVPKVDYPAFFEKEFPGLVQFICVFDFQEI